MVTFASISPVGQTPRSEKNVQSLEDDEIDEEIEEQLSGGEDLLKSEASAVSVKTPLSVCSSALSVKNNYQAVKIY